MMVHAAFESYLSTIGRCDLLPIDDYQRRLITKQQITADGKLPSVSDRVKLLMSTLGVDDDIAHAFVEVATVWRNRLIHPRAEPKLHSAVRGVLKRHASEIAQSHAGIDTRLLVSNLESAKYPTLKETTTIIAFLISTVTFIDGHFLSTAFPTEESAELYASTVLTADAQRNSRSFMLAHAAGPKKCLARLSQILIEAGFRKVSDKAGGSFPVSRVLDWVHRSRSDFAQTFALGTRNVGPPAS
jgi:hypothetical protein